MLRCETKFKGINVLTLLEYFTAIDKRMIWEGSGSKSGFEIIEQVKSYPMETQIHFHKTRSGLLGGAREMLLLT